MMWYKTLDTYLKTSSMMKSLSDHNLYYIYKMNNKTILVAYIDIFS